MSDSIPSEATGGEAPVPRTLALYHFDACPYCQRVRAAISELGVNVELRDILEEPEYRSALVEATGRRTVPVLWIKEGDDEPRWLPESRDIIAFLHEHYGNGRSSLLVRLQGRLTLLMWALLIAGGILKELQDPLWLAACAVGAGRSIANAYRTRAWYHGAIGAVFGVGMVAIGLRWSGVADLPWWYAAYALVGLIALVAIFLRFRASLRR